jgi:hypothetical protein
MVADELANDLMALVPKRRVRGRREVRPVDGTAVLFAEGLEFDGLSVEYVQRPLNVRGSGK